MDRIAENDPTVKRNRKIPVGNVVVYHGRTGSMRQGRTTFPAIVLQQHEDDGSLDLIVEYEAEDRIWEQRVLPRTDAQPGHCYTFVEPIEQDEDLNDHFQDYRDLFLDFSRELKKAQEVTKFAIDHLADRIEFLRTQTFGDFEEPEKSLMEYLDDFDKRLSKLERRK
jgi:hypothetical protein